MATTHDYRLASVQELLPADLGFSAIALSAGRKAGSVVRIAGFDSHALIMTTTGGAGTGRSELEFTGYAMDGTTVIVPRMVVLGGAADIFHTAGTTCAVVWGHLSVGSAFSPATTATFTAASMDPFRGVPNLLIELNPTTADGTATVNMWLYSMK